MKTFFIIIVTFCALYASAGKCVLSGYVFDHETKRPLAFAFVQLSRPEYQEAAPFLISNKNGYFEIRVEKGIYDMSCFYEGKKAISLKQVKLDRNKEDRNFYLENEIVQLKDVEIISDKISNRISCGTNCFSTSTNCFSNCYSLDSTLGTSRMEEVVNASTNGIVSLSEVRFYPNPTLGVLNIGIEGTGINEFFMTDISGKMLERFEAYNDQELHLNIAYYPAGIYFFRYLINDKWNAGKVILVNR